MDTASGIATAIWSGCKFSHLSTYVQPSNTQTSSPHVSHNSSSSLTAIIILFSSFAWNNVIKSLKWTECILFKKKKKKHTHTY